MSTVATGERRVLGKIADPVYAALDARTKSGASALTRGISLASGDGWEAADVICTAGPRDPAFEEQHGLAAVAIVVAGSFQYRTIRGLHVMTPGSFFLGNAGECFQCGHEHGSGDRCLSIHFTPAFVDRLASELGVRHAIFATSRVPPTRESAGVVASIATALADSAAISWEETAIDVATAALTASRDDRRMPAAEPRHALDSVTQLVREIEDDPSAERELRVVAADAGLSAFQFLRAFRRLTGTTPHQYLLRARLRDAAASLRTSDRKIVDVAFGCGFTDLSNFNHAFRAEFGKAPRAYRAAHLR